MTEVSKMWPQIFIALIIATVSGALGYGYSQSTINFQVVVNTREIQHLKDSSESLKAEQALEFSRLRADFAGERTRTDERIFQLVGLVTKVLEADEVHTRQADELISLIKLQNQVKAQ